MAIVPALATMAALTLLQNPAAQPEGVSVDYSPFAGPARRIQRAVRRLLRQRSYTRAVWRVGSRAFDTLYYGAYYGPGYGVVRELLRMTRPYDDQALYDNYAMRRTIFDNLY